MNGRPLGALALAAPTFTSVTDPGWLVGRDFNNDGRLDIATVAHRDTLQIFLGRGDGTFGAPLSFPLTPQLPTYTGWLAPLVAADFNGDGRLDLVTASWHGIVTVFLGRGDGSFHTGVESGPVPPDGWADSPGIGALSVGNLNGDGFADLVVAGATAARFVGDGTGTLRMLPGSAPKGDWPFLDRYWDCAILLDFDGDGKDDVIAASPVVGTESGRGQGDGNFAPLPGAPHPHDWGCFSAKADFNRDGKMDLLQTNSAVALGSGDGTFQAKPRCTGPWADTAVPLGMEEPADLDGDGNLDIAALAGFDPLGGRLAICLGRGDGTFQTGLTFPISQHAMDNGIYTFVLGDFNNDCRADVLIGDPQGNRFQLLLNTTP